MDLNRRNQSMKHKAIILINLQDSNKKSIYVEGLVNAVVILLIYYTDDETTIK